MSDNTLKSYQHLCLCKSGSIHSWFWYVDAEHSFSVRHYHMAFLSNRMHCTKHSAAVLVRGVRQGNYSHLNKHWPTKLDHNMESQSDTYRNQSTHFDLPPTKNTSTGLCLIPYSSCLCYNHGRKSVTWLSERACISFKRHLTKHQVEDNVNSKPNEITGGFSLLQSDVGYYYGLQFHASRCRFLQTGHAHRLVNVTCICFWTPEFPN